MGHPLLAILEDAAEGRFPVPDGRVTTLPPDDTGLEAVLSFTAHALVLTALGRTELDVTGIDGYAGSLAPDVLRRIAGPTGWIGVIDAVLVARGTGRGGTPLRDSDAHDAHPRVEYARFVRTDVRVLADERGLVTLGRGLGGRLDLGFETHDDEERGRGVGRSLLRNVLDEVPAGQLVVASCSPGNARSLRCLLAAGFTPIAAEAIVKPAPPRRGGVAGS